MINSQKHRISRSHQLSRFLAQGRGRGRIERSQPRPLAIAGRPDVPVGSRCEGFHHESDERNHAARSARLHIIRVIARGHHEHSSGGLASHSRQVCITRFYLASTYVPRVHPRASPYSR